VNHGSEITDYMTESRIATRTDPSQSPPRKAGSSLSGRPLVAGRSHFRGMAAPAAARADFQTGNRCAFHNNIVFWAVFMPNFAASFAGWDGRAATGVAIPPSQ